MEIWLLTTIRFEPKISINNKLSIAFTRAFTYENCTSTKEATKKDLYRVSWALAIEASIEHCSRMGNLQQKMARFRSMAVDDAIADS